MLATQVKRKEFITQLILDDTMWQHMKMIVRALFPGLIVLRMADSNKPCMDRLYFYVRRLDKCLEKSKSILDEYQKVIDDVSVPTYITTIMKDCGSNNIDDGDDTESGSESGSVNSGHSESEDELVDYSDEDVNIGDRDTLGDFLIE